MSVLMMGALLRWKKQMEQETNDHLIVRGKKKKVTNIVEILSIYHG